MEYVGVGSVGRSWGVLQLEGDYILFVLWSYIPSYFIYYYMGEMLYDSLDCIICSISLIIFYTIDWMILINRWLILLKQMGNQLLYYLLEFSLVGKTIINVKLKKVMYPFINNYIY